MIKKHLIVRRTLQARTQVGDESISITDLKFPIEFMSFGVQQILSDTEFELKRWHKFSKTTVVDMLTYDQKFRTDIRLDWTKSDDASYVLASQRLQPPRLDDMCQYTDETSPILSVGVKA